MVQDFAHPQYVQVACLNAGPAKIWRRAVSSCRLLAPEYPDFGTTPHVDGEN